MPTHCNAILFCVTGKQAKYIKPGNTRKNSRDKNPVNRSEQNPGHPDTRTPPDTPGSDRVISLQFVLYGLQLNNSLMIYIIWVNHNLLCKPNRPRWGSEMRKFLLYDTLYFILYIKIFALYEKIFSHFIEKIARFERLFLLPNTLSALHVFLRLKRFIHPTGYSLSI